ncbi:hypothetical protein QMK19_22315 [Streptomyces sp. H10-C2]|uniref:hypothetical protein n=1 Tax=unclassified Streptomyces TaxID=2593676 RepID=UPI0024BB38B6|nr:MULTISPECIES: hypothetical protein [unclassified Streptomyces]MDJ0342471.1 hypothetical protein [Streptomyces sp. PH10-H1]MDJ0372326.1 hypothetical protein [Streptomyces sp. H10-C2]
MHSGHGDETPDDQYRRLPAVPEPHSGVVLPAEQPLERYGDHVRPAGGQPWDQVSGAAQPLPPEAGAGADATMMFPPYPQAVPPAPPIPAMPPGPPAMPAAPPAPPRATAPVPEADATQFLPPYPRETPPAAPQPSATPQQPEPYVPEPFTPRPFTPEPFTPEPFGAGRGYPAETAAEATAHLPLSIFEEQPYDQPYAAEPPYGRQHEQSAEPPQPAPQGDYDHLYRQDGPRQQPMPEQPRQQQYRAPAQAQPPVPAPGYAEPPYDGAGNGDGNGGGGGSRRRMSPAAVIGIVVGGCALAGLAAGAALSAGGGDSKAAAKASTSPAASTGASAQPGAGDSATAQQATALDALLKDSGSSRSSVISAVESIKSCKNLGQAAADLRAAGGQRGTLVTRLTAVPVDKLPQHAELTDALNKAWLASAAADNAYALWADQAASDGKTCKGGHAKGTPQKSVGDRESGGATQQKKRAVRIWNTIAKQYSLADREYTQL